MVVYKAKARNVWFEDNSKFNKADDDTTTTHLENNKLITDYGFYKNMYMHVVLK